MFEHFTSQARHVVVQARQEARQLHHGHVGTEHLLLAMLDAGSGGAHTLLRNAGMDQQRVRSGIERLAGRPTGLLSEGDAAALESIGIDLRIVKAKIEETFGPGALEPFCPPSPRRRLWRRRHPRHSQGPPAFSPRAKKVLELSLREALRLGHGYIGPEHILLGLLREGAGLAAMILTDAGVVLPELRQQTLAALHQAA